MPLSPAFSIYQSALDPSIIIAEDTSSGSDGTVTARRLYVQDAEGNYLVVSGTSTQYNPWPLASNPESFSLLTTDTAVSITVQWVNNVGGVVYSLTQEYCLAEYNKQFFYYLCQQLGLQPGTMQDNTMFINMANLWTAITGAIQAVEIGDDISGSQNLLNIATNYRTNQTFYF